MGSLKRFNIQKMNSEYGLNYFFETGTWKGDGLAYARKFGFEKLISTEIIPSIADAAKKRFKNYPEVEIVMGNSTEIIETKFDSLPGNCLFWLDAHFPGAEEKIKDYNEYNEEDIKLPLKKEIELIANLRRNYNDVILIDDLRIYESGPFESGNLPENILPPSVRNIDFVYENFENTHKIIRSYANEGYLLILPKIKVKENTFGLRQIIFRLRNIFRDFVY